MFNRIRINMVKKRLKKEIKHARNLVLRKKTEDAKKEYKDIRKLYLKLYKEKQITYLEKLSIYHNIKHLYKQLDKITKEKIKSPRRVRKKGKKKGEQKRKKGRFETVFDDLYYLIQERGSVKITDVAEHFHITKEKAEKWGKILEEHSLVEIYYPAFTSPQLRKKGFVKKIKKKRKKRKRKS